MQEGEPLVRADSSVQDHAKVNIGINFLECIGGMDEPHPIRYFKWYPPVPGRDLAGRATSSGVYQLPRKQEKRSVRQSVVKTQAVNHGCHPSKGSCNLSCSKRQTKPSVFFEEKKETRNKFPASSSFRGYEYAFLTRLIPRWAPYNLIIRSLRTAVSTPYSEPHPEYVHNCVYT